MVKSTSRRIKSISKRPAGKAAPPQAGRAGEGSAQKAFGQSSRQIGDGEAGRHRQAEIGQPSVRANALSNRSHVRPEMAYKDPTAWLGM
jgi:hypothetical protein